MKNRIVNFGIRIFAICLLLILVGCNTRNVEDIVETRNVYIAFGDRSFVRDINDLLDGNPSLLLPASTYVVRAEVLDSRTEYFDSPTWEIITIHRIKVLESFRGNTEVGDVLEFGLSGGRLGNLEIVDMASNVYRVPLSSGDEFIFFLRRPAEWTYSFWYGIHDPSWRDLFISLTCNSTSVYRIPPHLTSELSSGFVDAFNQNPMLEDEVLISYNLTVFEFAQIDLTIGDLMRIAGVLEE